MNRRMVALMGVVLVPALAGVAVAKGPPKKAPAPKVEAPPVPPEVTRTVDAFVGRWRFDGSLTPPGAKESLKAKFLFTCRKAAGGRAAACDFTARFPGMSPMEETQVWAFNPEDQKVHLVAVNTSGEVHDHQGAWKDEQTLEFEPLKTTDDGKPVEDSLVVTWDSPKSVSFDAVTSYPDGSIVIFRGKGKRM